DMAYRELLEKASFLDPLEQRGEKLNGGFPDLLKDLYGLLFKLAPVMNPEETLAPTHRAHRGWLATVAANPAYNRLRVFTRLDEVSSMIGVRQLGEILLTVMTPDSRNQGDRAEPSSSSGKEEGDRAGGTASEDGDQSDMDRQVERALDRSAEEAELLQQLYNWGRDRASPSSVSLRERITLAEEILRNPDFRKLARLMGRMKRIALASRPRCTKGVPGGVIDVETGQDLAVILPSELMDLPHPVRSRDFHRRFLERKLLQYGQEGKENLGRGPLVICLDSSGSMRGETDLLAKAVTLALVELARRERRNCAVILFSHPSHGLEGQWSHPGIRTFHFGKQTGPALITEMATAFLDGGTAFGPPLEETIRVLRSDEHRHLKGADTIFITDGAAALLSEPLMAQIDYEKRHKDLRIIGILIGKGARRAVIESFAEVCLSIENPRQPEAWEEILQHLARSLSRSTSSRSAQSRSAGSRSPGFSSPPSARG
ncbi:MAG: hypothetical protein HYY09_09125, partial [Firmicutes bacterium]|nr:hypothetical protein [Bacillota bacterium]